MSFSGIQGQGTQQRELQSLQMGAGPRSLHKNGFLEKHKPAVYFVNFITLREKKRSHFNKEDREGIPSCPFIGEPGHSQQKLTGGCGPNLLATVSHKTQHFY